MKSQLAYARALHDADLQAGCGEVELPEAPARKYPRAPREWAWRFVFPSHALSTDPRSGSVRRHHVYENYLIRGVKDELLGHADVSTTMLYTHVLNRGGQGVRSPLDA